VPTLQSSRLPADASSRPPQHWNTIVAEVSNPGRAAASLLIATRELAPAENLSKWLRVHVMTPSESAHEQAVIDQINRV
jgi:hypothetical protein